MLSGGAGTIPLPLRHIPCGFVALCLLRFALRLYLLHTLAVGFAFFLRHGGAVLAAPCMRYTLPPVSESASGQVVTMQAIPACRIAALAVGGEAVQLAVSMDHIRRSQSSPGHGIAELLNCLHGWPPTVCAAGGLCGPWLRG